jgi:hypothetical protein
MEVKSIVKKTKKLGTNSSTLPAIDHQSLCYGIDTSVKREKESNPLTRRYGKYGGVRVLLPNFRYKKDKFYFHMKNPYDLSYSNFLLKTIYSMNFFYIQTDLPGISKIQIHYELMKEERDDGLLCKLYLENPRDFGMKDYQGICKMVEMSILNMNPTDTYEFISYQDVFCADGNYPHIYEDFYEIEELPYKYKEKVEEEEENPHKYKEYDFSENQENEEFNSQWIYVKS